MNVKISSTTDSKGKEDKEIVELEYIKDRRSQGVLKSERSPR